MSTVHYTANEEKLLKLLRKRNGKKLSSLDIVKLHYKDAPPKFARQSVVCVLNGLVRKTKRARKTDGFVVCKTDRTGPHPNKYWIEANGEDFQKLRSMFD